ncbi:asparagine synthase [Microbacterium sp. gxy059]|uniref:asparagine synthase n=1 Tax=Microbacterium sp. gxy059 TaxID=2957199 RepID=UPI003D981D4D
MEEGVAIALAAVRLQVKNRILVGTITRDDDFDPDAFSEDAREALHALADEQENASIAMKQARRQAWGRHSDSRGTHDYRDRDTRNLRRRAKQYGGVAKKLRELAEDPDQVRTIVEDARSAAWHDVEMNLDRRLSIEAMRPEDDPEYARMREARMEALMFVDLQRLAGESKRRHQQADDGSH